MQMTPLTIKYGVEGQNVVHASYSSLLNFVEWFFANNSKTTGQTVMSNAEISMWLRPLVTEIFAKNHSTKLGNRL